MFNDLCDPEESVQNMVHSNGPKLGWNADKIQAIII